MVGKFYKDGAYNTIGSQMVIAEQEFIATADQTLFTLTTGTYTPGANRLAIFVNGTRQPQTAYTESSSTTFTMASGLEAGDKILAQILSFNETAIGAAHGSTHKPGGGDAIGLIVADVGGSNRNLLHNWDFKQPVNLLGASSYTTSGTSIATISRWRINTGTLTVNSGYVTTTTGSIFFQMMPEAWVKRFLGKTLTLTLEKSDGTILSGTITLPLANPEVFTEYYAINSGGIAFSTTLGVSGSPTHFQFFRLTNTTGADLSIKRVKLEVGSASTLVNDPPADYFEQISLCQTISDSIPAFQGGYGSNKNILHNWDLRNPVNQRAASSYSGASGSYTIDRWRYW
jgi:hypothetical protein